MAQIFILVVFCAVLIGGFALIFLSPGRVAVSPERRAEIKAEERAYRLRQEQKHRQRDAAGHRTIIRACILGIVLTVSIRLLGETATGIVIGLGIIMLLSDPAK
jgi:hypothetical protein